MMALSIWFPLTCAASMKVPPKRKGNFENLAKMLVDIWSLNESPSEKEGK